MPLQFGRCGPVPANLTDVLIDLNETMGLAEGRTGTAAESEALGRHERGERWVSMQAVNEFLVHKPDHHEEVLRRDGGDDESPTLA